MDDSSYQDSSRASASQFSNEGHILAPGNKEVVKGDSACVEKIESSKSRPATPKPRTRKREATLPFNQPNTIQCNTNPVLQIVRQTIYIPDRGRSEIVGQQRGEQQQGSSRESSMSTVLAATTPSSEIASKNINSSTIPSRIEVVRCCSVSG